MQLIKNEVKKRDHAIKNICCIGAGYVGGPTMAVIADKCPHINITVVDVNKDRIDFWNHPDVNNIPVFEPGLSNIISRVRGVNLHFSTEVNDEISKADMVFLCVNTPTKTKGLGAGKASDLKWIEACARQVAKSAVGHTIVVEKSTLPVRTAKTIQTILESSQPFNSESNGNKTFSVLSNPEFLAEGTAIKDLESPDRVLIGGEDNQAINSLSDIYSNWVPDSKIIKTNLWSSELSKLSANAFLAQRISSINSIAAFCEATGGDVREVAKAIGSDNRIGSKFLQAGPGFGGSCFKKDILNLTYLSEYFGLKEVANYWESVIALNEWQKQRIARKVVDNLFGTISGKSIAILGFSFKANTNDTRESPSIDIAKKLLEEGANLFIHDPKVEKNQIEKDLNIPEFKYSEHDENILRANNEEGSWMYKKSIKDALYNVDAAIILTEWNDYSNIKWDELSLNMRRPAWVFDTRSVVKPDEIKKAGLNLWRLGD